MNKKIMTMTIAVVIMMLSVSLISVANAETKKSNEKKRESPLFKIRSKGAIREKIQDIKTNYLGDRIFLLPFNRLSNLLGRSEDSMLFTKVWTLCFGGPKCNLQQSEQPERSSFATFGTCKGVCPPTLQPYC